MLIYYSYIFSQCTITFVGRCWMLLHVNKRPKKFVFQIFPLGIAAPSSFESCFREFPNRQADKPLRAAQRMDRQVQKVPPKKRSQLPSNYD